MESVPERSFRDELINFLQSQPTDITAEDIMYHLYVIQKINKGQQEFREGKAIPDEDVEAIIQKWLK